MREIKFRCWDIFNKQWIPIVVLDSNGEIYFLTSRQGDEDLVVRGPLKKDGLKIMQFTGLQDKNGKDIYEEDILLHKSFNKWRQVGPVTYIDDMYCFDFGLNSNVMDQEVGCAKPEELEVIGNLHENQELMEQQ